MPCGGEHRLRSGVASRAPRYNQSNVLEVDPVSGRAAPLLDDSPLLPGLQMNFQAAAARLLTMPL